jgi:hypothetical protein
VGSLAKGAFRLEIVAGRKSIPSTRRDKESRWSVVDVIELVGQRESEIVEPKECMAVQSVVNNAYRLVSYGNRPWSGVWKVAGAN